MIKKLKKPKTAREDTRTTVPRLVVDTAKPQSERDYEGVIRATLIDLGTNDPDFYLRASGDLWKRCRDTGVDARTCAAVMYGSMRHQHEVARTTVKEASESPTRGEWEVVVRRTASMDDIFLAAGRKPDEVDNTKVIYGDFYDDEKAQAFAQMMTKKGFIASYGPRPAVAAESSAAESSALESRPISSRRELGILMHNWHASMGDPLYAVGSYYVEDRVYPRKDVVEDAKSEAERLSRKLSGRSAEKQELRQIIRGLDHFLLADYPAGVAESKKADDGGVVAVTTTTTAVAADEGRGEGGVQSQIAAKTQAECKTCIPWQKVSRDGKQHEEFSALSKKFGPIKTPLDVYAVCGADLNNETQEVFLVLPLDIHGHLMGPAYEVARGQRDRVAVGIDNVMDAASDARCAGFLCVHQHPGSSPKPSDADIRLTRDIKKATPPGRVFIDHVIVSPGGAYSCMDKRLYKVKENGQAK